jgi:hypothetical protein
MESLLEMRPSVLAFSTSFCAMAEDTQLVAEVVFPLAMVFLVARCFTRIYQSALGGYAREEKEAEIGNGGGGGEEELVNSRNPHYPFIYLLGEGTWAEMWRKERKWQPTNGQENTKLPHYPRNGSRSLRVTYSKNWPLTSRRRRHVKDQIRQVHMFDEY